MDESLSYRFLIEPVWLNQKRKGSEEDNKKGDQVALSPSNEPASGSEGAT
jgi:hypothetical protein